MAAAEDRALQLLARRWPSPALLPTNASQGSRGSQDKIIPGGKLIPEKVNIR